MELAKITSKGQITIPIAIRKRLGLKDGDKILFVEKENRIEIMNATLEAFQEAQAAFAGVAQRVGIRNEDDVVALVKEVRADRSKLYTCE